MRSSCLSLSFFAFIFSFSGLGHADPIQESVFGEEVAACDFNGDGRDDLVVSAPKEDVGPHPNAGAIHVIYGHTDGLQQSAPARQHFSQDTLGMAQIAASNAAFGAALGAADFNADGYCDLAVGSPGYSQGGHPSAGAVQVLYGTNSGLSYNIPNFPNPVFNAQIFVQGSGGLSETKESYDTMGAALATGDFNSDGYADLAIGAPGEDYLAKANTGYVHIVYGGAQGLSTVNTLGFFQHWVGVAFESEAEDQMGEALAAGDFNADGYDDIAIGIPGEDNDTGRVRILWGTQSGIDPWAGEQQLKQGFNGIAGAQEAGDRFGEILASGYMNSDSIIDLAIGVPGEDIGSIVDAGAVNVMYGSQWGLSGRNDQIWHQNTSGVIGVCEAGDLFGDALTVADFNGDGLDDLAVGVYGESIGSIHQGGAVNVLYAAPAGLTASGDQIWHQNRSGVLDSVEAGDRFGFNVAAGDFDGDRFLDLAVGVPDEDIFENGVNFTNAGAVNVLYGSASKLAASDDQFVIGDDILE